MGQVCLDLCYLLHQLFLSGDDANEISKTLSIELDKLNIMVCSK